MGHINIEEKNYYAYWWAAQEGNYCKPLRQISDEAGGAENLYYMSKKQLAELKGVSDKYAEIICERRKRWNLKEEYDKCIQNGVKFITYDSEEYPVKLKEISSSPYALFVKGNLPNPAVKSVAIIGARDCSQYGRLVAEDLGKGLAGYGVQVISGMAYGIDGIAQMSTLDAGGISYGILGCGPDICYPRTNKVLYERLIECGGVISEYSPGTHAQSRLFPPRNRIIAGLSDLIVVVEAKKKSGTAITVDMALDMGKEIAVIPGRINDSLSEGCINLWKMGAAPVCCAEDIMSILEPEFSYEDNVNNLERVHLDELEKTIYEKTDTVRPVSFEELMLQTKLNGSMLSYGILSLEMQDCVLEISSGYYIRKKEIILV